jgi:hypothetical protein
MNPDYHCSCIDLSRYLNKKVKVTFRTGGTHVDTIVSNTSGNYQKTHPYLLSKWEYSYTKDGSYHPEICEDHYNDIMEIELVDQPKYHHLEEQVKELQKEIQRLKDEEGRIMADYGDYKVVKHFRDPSMVNIYKNDTVITNRTIPIHVMRKLAEQMAK